MIISFIIHSLEMESEQLEFLISAIWYRTEMKKKENLEYLANLRKHLFLIPTKISLWFFQCFYMTFLSLCHLIVLSSLYCLLFHYKSVYFSSIIHFFCQLSTNFELTRLNTEQFSQNLPTLNHSSEKCLNS